jgi:hypothetical protein
MFVNISHVLLERLFPRSNPIFPPFHFFLQLLQRRGLLFLIIQVSQEPVEREMLLHRESMSKREKLTGEGNKK